MWKELLRRGYGHLLLLIRNIYFNYNFRTLEGFRMVLTTEQNDYPLQAFKKLQHALTSPIGDRRQQQQQWQQQQKQRSGSILNKLRP